MTAKAGDKKGAGGEDIVTLDDGFAQVKKNGIEPFISLVETNEREFFKAKDFVALYEYVPALCCLPLQLQSPRWTSHPSTQR